MSADKKQAYLLDTTELATVCTECGKPVQRELYVIEDNGVPYMVVWRDLCADQSCPGSTQ